MKKIMFVTSTRLIGIASRSSTTGAYDTGGTMPLFLVVGREVVIRDRY